MLRRCRGGGIAINVIGIACVFAAIEHVTIWEEKQQQ